MGPTLNLFDGEFKGSHETFQENDAGTDGAFIDRYFAMLVVVGLILAVASAVATCSGVAPHSSATAAALSALPT